MKERRWWSALRNGEWYFSNWGFYMCNTEYIYRKEEVKVKRCTEFQYCVHSRIWSSVFADVPMRIWCRLWGINPVKDSLWRGISWFSSLSFPLSHAFIRLPPTPLGSLSTTSPPPLVLSNNTRLFTSGCYRFKKGDFFSPNDWQHFF